MKIGLSSYSLVQALNEEFTILDAIRWVSENGGEHIEIVPMGFDLEADPSLIEQIRQTAAEVGIDISNYAVSGNIIGKTGDSYEAEISRLKKQVDIAAELGAKRLRHDIASRPETSVEQFEEDFPTIVSACREVAVYASQYGITTSIENHGFYLQAAERVQRVVLAVDRENFKTTLDVGNFLCVDEDPQVSTKANLPVASMVHFKDFYIRNADRVPGEGWFQSANGRYLRGAIVGQGDIAIPEIVEMVKKSGYDGYISIEFEGMEDCKKGSRIGMANVKRFWEQG